MTKPIFKLIRQFLCFHEFAEMWWAVIKYPDGAELGYTTDICVKCGKED